MIDASYLNGDREKKFALWMAKAKKIGILSPKEVEVVSNESVALSMVAVEKITKLAGREYLVPFSCQAKRIEEVHGAIVKYEIPGNFTREMEHLEIERRVISLDYNIVCGITDQLLGGASEFGYGAFPVDSFIPAPPYSDSSTGQMKLIVDFALAIDEMREYDKKDNYRILVIGCGSPGGVRSGVAYSLVPFVCNAIVDMFDPHEISRNYEVEADYFVTYNVYGSKFVYGITSGRVKYDLVIDDSWVKGVSRNDRDQEDWVSTVPHFSIKQFPWERNLNRKGNIYYQRFWTEGLEERRVSRDPRNHSIKDHVQLGKCVACRELRFRLLGNYSNAFYMEIMNLHEKNCKTGAREYVELITNYNSWIRVDPFVIDYSNYCSMNYNYIDGTRMASVGIRGPGSLRFMFTSFKGVPERILVNAYQVLVVISSEEYYVSKVISERIFGKKDVIRREGLVNLAHNERDDIQLYTGKGSGKNNRSAVNGNNNYQGGPSSRKGRK